VTLSAPKAGAAYRIKVSGLKGGHSGVDIHLGRGNAVRILGAVLGRALDLPSVQIGELKGGSAHNAIPREAWAIVVVDKAQAEDLRKLVAQAQSDYKTDLGGFDPDIQIALEDATAPAKVMSSEDARAIADLLVTIPHGVIAMSPDVPGLVQNSTNLATVTMNGDTVEIVTSQRSAIQSSRDAVARMVATACRLAGFEVSQGAGYPGWKPEPNSEIIKKLQKAHEEVFGKPAKLIAMHAGLECGVIGERYPGMQMASFGPQIENPHSPNERVEIPSVEGFWKFLRRALEVL
jgi:dipeptidase D